ncbi:MAG: SHOCT domain-containing protein [Candidatus Thermoplasmatota archaeon]
MQSQKMTPLAWLGIALVVAIGLMVAFGTLSVTTYGGYYGMMGSGAWGWGLLMMAVPGVILFLVLWAALGGLDGRAPAPAYPAYSPFPGNPLEILDNRYARGELSREEYQRMRDDLTRGPAHS